MSWADNAAFRVDREYDREHASNGVTRFGTYILRSSPVTACWDGTFLDDEDRARAQWFAVAAWETASPPVMSPPYLHHHPRVRAASLASQTQARVSLVGRAELVAPWPAPLAASGDWKLGRPWRNWPVERYLDTERYYDLADDGMIEDRYLLASIKVEFPLEVDLPPAPSGPDEAAALAGGVISVLVTAMNDVVTPVLEALEA